MGCYSNVDRRRLDLKDEILNEPKILYENGNDAINNNHKRKYTLSTKNSGDEFEDEANDINFDEQKARDLVNILLEEDVSFYKNLIPKINSFSYQDFKNLFEGNCNHNYNTTNKTQIIRLAHKFDNFYYILENSYREKKYYQYLKELWLKYPYIEDLKYLRDDNKISSKLSSSLPNYSSWPNDIKKDLLEIIKKTQLVSINIINKIKDEYKEVDRVLQRLANIKKEFSAEDNDEYLTKNNNVLSKDIEKIYNYMNQNSKGKKRKLTDEEKAKIQKDIKQQKKDFEDISPYLQDNLDCAFDMIVSFIVKEWNSSESFNDLSNQMKVNYMRDNDDLFYDNDFFSYEDDDDYFDDCYNDDENPNSEQNQNQENLKEIMEWIEVAKNFVFCIYRGYKMFQTINLAKKFIKENIYRTELNEISSKFNEYQISKRFDKNDPKKNLKIINEYIDKIEIIRKQLLNLIKKLKKEIDKNIKKKKGILGNIIYQIFKLGGNIFKVAITKDPTKIIDIINIGIGVANLTFSGIELSLSNEIIDELINILKDAKKKQKEIENEINSLNEKALEIRKVYPNYYKKI